MRLFVVTGRVSGYGMLVLAGSILATYGPPFTGAYWIMGSMLAIGASFACLGGLFDLWFGEFVGMPLMLSALLAFAYLTFIDGWDAVGWVVVPSVALLASFGTLMLARWLDLFSLVRASIHKRQADRDKLG